MAEKLIAEINFDRAVDYKTVAIMPVLMSFDRWLFRLNTWAEFVKIFYYLMYQTDEGPAAIEQYVGKRRADGSAAFILEHAADGHVQKFSPCYYARFDDETTYRNILLPVEIREIASRHNFRLWVKRPTTSANSIEPIIAKTLAQATQKGRENRYTVKSTKYFIAHINGECLSEAEKFYLRIEKEFDKKKLLGDIVTTAREDELLSQYMQVALRSFVMCTSTMYRPSHEKVFAYGLVRFAMKNYSQRTFWPYFKEEFDIEISPNRQGDLHNLFRAIMLSAGKTYDDSLKQKIDNINLHSFVVDKCADQLFDYLFDFWRLDLKRNIDNARGEEGRSNFNALISELMRNNEQSVPDVMKHTSMALALNEKSCKLRIRRILNIIDACFWDTNATIPATGNRINELMRAWMGKESGKFRNERKIIEREHSGRGETLLLSPQLYVRYLDNSFYVKLPREILRGCSEEEHPIWTISTDGVEPISVEPPLLLGRIGLYTDEVETRIPDVMLQRSITMVLQSQERKHASFQIKDTGVRMFNESGKNLDLSRSLPTGLVICYSNTESIPQVLYQEAILPHRVGTHFVGQYQLNKGDLVKLPDQRILQVGESLAEGLQGGLLVDGVCAHGESGLCNVYATLPKIVFKAPKAQIDGIAVIVKSADNERLLRAADYPYYSFKLDESLADACAYIINLADYVKADGCYKIAIDIPGGKVQKIFDLCYIRGFQYCFEGAPYVFTDVASLALGNATRFDLRKDEKEMLRAGENLTYVFDPANKDCSDRIKGETLQLDYIYGGQKITLSFIIPAFRWKFNKTDEWSYHQPSNKRAKDFPSYMYIDAPRDVIGKEAKIYIDFGYSPMGEGESDIPAETVKDEDYYAFHIANLKSWLTHDVEKRSIRYSNKGHTIELFDVICHSTIVSHTLCGDFLNNTIYGSFEINGDSDYSAEIKYGDELICQDVPIIDGKFEVDAPLREGDYTVTIYEIEEDDSGFDSFSFPLASFVLNLVDLRNLRDCSIRLNSIQDIRGETQPIPLSTKYFIKGLKRLEYGTEALNGENIYLWSMDSSDEDAMSRCVFYEGTMGFQHWTGNYAILCEVLVILINGADPNDMIILRKEGEEYYELLYDRSQRKLLASDEARTKAYRIKNISVLADDCFKCHVEVYKETCDVPKHRALTKEEGDTLLEPLLSVRAKNSLRLARIIYLRDLQTYLKKHKLSEMLQIRNFGAANVAEIKRICEQYNLHYEE